MTEVNKEFAEAAWKAHDDGKSGLQIAFSTDVSPTTVSRLIRSRKLFQAKRMDGEIANKTGWSVGLVAKVRQWWSDYDSSQNHEQTLSPEHVETMPVAVPERRKAKEDHLDEVRRLIEEWKKCFTVRPSWDIWWAGPDPFAEIKTAPLFAQLETHLDPQIWENHLRFEQDNQAYLEGATELRTAIRERAPWGLDLPLTTERTERGVRKQYGDVAFTLALGLTQGTRTLDKLGSTYRVLPSDSPGTDLKLVIAAGREILAVTGDAEYYVEGHRSLVQSLAASTEVQELVRMHGEIATLVTTMSESIDLLLFSRDYVLRSCAFAVCAGVQAPA